MAGTRAFLWQIATVLIPAAALGLTLWQKRKKPDSLSSLVPVGVGAVLTVLTLIFVRQALGIYRLQHLTAERISSISYAGRTLRDPAQIAAIVGALHESGWWSARSAAVMDPKSFSIHFMDGSEWEMVVGSNRYGSGTIIRMADREFSRGYAYSAALNQILATQPEKK